jgi:cyclopropane-fatty-acyl-phospholipid synthase
MTSTSTFAPASLPDSAPAAARAVFRLLQRLRHGSLDLQMPDGSSAHFGNKSDDGPRAALRLRNWNVCSAVLRSGDIGFAESYIAGDWTTPDLTVLLTLFIANRDEVEAIVYGSWWGSALYRLKHLFNRNSRQGSKKNIHAHYDLGNEFYRLWLDPTMNYSSAWFEGDHSKPMPDAQHAKVRRALREAGSSGRPRAGDRLRLGRAGRMRGARVRREGDWRDAVQRAARVGEEAPERCRPARRPALPGLSRHRRRPFRRHRLHRDVRGRGPRVLAELLRHRA